MRRISRLCSNYVRSIKLTQMPKFKFCMEIKIETQAEKDVAVLNILNSESTQMFRNIAIIAHVDHGKTTLVDTLIKNAGIENQKSMDSNQLEREKGITILSKCTGITYKGFKINIVDTPGHHDFGGEVERIMDMVDGVALVVCASEGPMTQTKFVLEKALKQGLKTIVIINKADRPSQRIKEVENEIFDLFCTLDASDEILEYPLFYASAKNGWAVTSMDDAKDNMTVILEGIINHIPAPKVDKEGKFSMLVSQTESNQYFGKMLIGRIASGQINLNEMAISIDQTGERIQSSKVLKIIRRYGTNQLEMTRAVAGDIVSIAGFANSTVGHILNHPENNNIIKSLPIEPPMISIQVLANNSPLGGQEGTKLTAQVIKEFLIQEAENDVALKINTEDNKITLIGRGDLHLGVLLERMRRDGFEMLVSPPEVMTRVINGELCEPYENVSIESSPEYSNAIIEKMNNRKADYIDCVDLGEDKQKLTFNCPTRGLIGLRSQLMNDTKGTAVLSNRFDKFGAFKGTLKKSFRGALVASCSGTVSNFAMKENEKFGTLFVEQHQKVYAGMVIGENLKDMEVEINITKDKALNNIRTKAHEEQVRLQPPKVFSIEEAISYIRDDELLEITPKCLRIRKKELDPAIRKKKKRDERSHN